MKKTLFITLLTLLSIVCFGQDGGTLKFLGIPIDGTEAQFAAKLKSKGFTYNTVYESYKGGAKFISSKHRKKGVFG